MFKLTCFCKKNKSSENLPNNNEKSLKGWKDHCIKDIFVNWVSCNYIIFRSFNYTPYT